MSWHEKSRDRNPFWHFGNPAVSVRPVGFPSHPRGWFSIIVYHVLYAVNSGYTLSLKSFGMYVIEITKSTCSIGGY
jgi:hypothetical protein